MYWKLYIDFAYTLKVHTDKHKFSFLKNVACTGPLSYDIIICLDYVEIIGLDIDHWLRIDSTFALKNGMLINKNKLF